LYHEICSSRVASLSGLYGVEKVLSLGSRALVIRPGALGDTILSLPAIRALRLAVGSTGRIEVVGYPTPLRLAVNPRHADVAHSVDRRLFAGLFSDHCDAELKRFLKTFDVVIAWCNDGEGCLLNLLRELELPHVLAPPFPPEASEVHAADYFRKTLAPLGVKGASQPELWIQEDIAESGASILREKGLWGRDFIAIHPGSGSSRKNWKPERFSGLASLAKESGLEPVLLEGDADWEAIRAVTDHLGWIPHTFKNLNLPILASVVSQAWAYVGNDSGVTHLSAAAGPITVALFGPTNPAIWAPRGPKVHVMSLESSAADVWHAIRKISSL
jgi:ADP-heptose:LPS heptosyltransferase